MRAACMHVCVCHRNGILNPFVTLSQAAEKRTASGSDSFRRHTLIVSCSRVETCVLIHISVCVVFCVRMYIRGRGVVWLGTGSGTGMGMRVCKTCNSFLFFPLSSISVANCTSLMTAVDARNSLNDPFPLVTSLWRTTRDAHVGRIEVCHWSASRQACGNPSYYRDLPVPD